MSLTKGPSSLPSYQQAIRDRCFHSIGTFIEYRKEEVEQSIPERFEKQVEEAQRLTGDSNESMMVTDI